LVALGRAAIPPAPLFLARAVIAWDVLSTDALELAPSPISADELRQRGLIAYTPIYAPAGLSQSVIHVWRRNGQVVNVVNLSPVRGGRQEGFRTYSRKTSFPADPTGRWTVDVETSSGQLIGRLLGPPQQARRGEDQRDRHGRAGGRLRALGSDPLGQAGRRQEGGHRPGSDVTPDLFDTHAHLHFPEFADDLDAVLARARAAGVRHMVTIGTDVPSSRAAVALAAREPDVWAAVGIHPHEASLADPAQLAEIERLAAAPRVVAIGETGLDFLRNLSPRHAPPPPFRAP